MSSSGSPQSRVAKDLAQSQDGQDGDRQDLTSSANSRPYKYRPLTRKREIRLVRLLDPENATIWTRDPWTANLFSKDQHFAKLLDEGFPVECSIEHALLDDRPAYIAVSYTWGDATKLNAIYVSEEDGTTSKLHVTANLYAALRHLRPEILPNLKDGKALLWIDSLCINQADEKEKSCQTQQMYSIYREALHVMAWLGPQIERSSEFMEEILASFEEARERYCECDDDEELLSWDLNGKFTLLPALSAFTELPYWHRAWVQQEIYAAQGEIWLQWGPKIVSIGMVSSFIMGLDTMYKNMCHQRSVSRASGSLTAVDIGAVIRGQGYKMMSQVINERNLDEEARSLVTLDGLLDIIYVCGCGLKASDPRDLIFALLGMARDTDDLGLIPDYSKKTEDVYIEVAVAMVKQGRYSVLHFANRLPIDPAQLDGQKLPSWVPDWRFPIPCTIGFFGLQSVSYESNSLAKSRFLDADSKNSQDSIIPSDDLRLSSYGFQVDEILAVSQILTFEDFAPTRDDGANGVLSCQKRLGQAVISQFKEADLPLPLAAEWLFELENLIYSFISKDGSLKEVEDLAWRVPIGDVEFTIENEYKRASDAFKPGYELVRNFATQPDAIYAWNENDISLVSRYWRVMDSQSKGRKFLVSKKGYLGLGPRVALPGDLIVVLLAAYVPLIIRPLQNGHFHIVGEAYVNDLMDGQALGGDYTQREFLIE